MPSNTDSFGVFVSANVVARHDKEGLRKMCFKTTSNWEFPHRSLDGEDRLATQPESMEVTYQMGAKASKYMGIMNRDAKNWGRDQCMYTTQFPKHPLGDSVVNKMLAQRYNPNFQGRAPSAPIEMGRTTYGADFAGRSREERRAAKLGLQRPVSSAGVTTGNLLERTSASHRLHAAPNPEAREKLASKTQMPVDNLAVDGCPSPDFLMRSTYGSSFSQLRASTSPGNMRQHYLEMSRSVGRLPPYGVK